MDIGSASLRYGSLRLSVASYIVSFALFISIFDFINTKNKTDFINIIVCSFFFFYAVKTRTEIMYIISTIYIIIILFIKKRNFKIIMIMLGLIIFGTLLLSGFFSNYYSSLENDDGVNMRFYTIDYYTEQIKEKPILGMGYIKQNINDKLDILLFGEKGYYYRDDVGFIGTVNESGVVGGLLYLSLIIILLRMIIKLYKFDKLNYLWMLSIAIYIIFCSINITYMSHARITALVLFISMVYHYYNLFINKKNS